MAKKKAAKKKKTASKKLTKTTKGPITTLIEEVVETAKKAVGKGKPKHKK